MHADPAAGDDEFRRQPVGWVERSETHRLAAAAFQEDDGFRFVQPILPRCSDRSKMTPSRRFAIESERRVGKGAQRRAHVGVNEYCKSAVGTLRFAHPTLAGRIARK